ncbi:MAG: glutamate racemase [Clostridia bacterium]|nr:glutamate racemase [Clostridia bacterium]
MDRYIGILDSGVGGISVLREAVKLLPNENFIYYGDNKNAPYGPKPIEEIVQLSKNAVDYLLSRNVKALVLACNTITSAYAKQLRSEVTIPVIGMEPAVKPASLARCGGKILALATKATLSLDKFSVLMENYGEGVIPLEGKGLVEIVESGKRCSPEAHNALEEIFKPYLNEQIDGIVLGCTHYPFLRRQIEQFFPDAMIFDGLEGTVRQLKRRLAEENRLNSVNKTGDVRFETSGSEDTIELMKKLFTEVI